jgi:hypothetical protein
MGVGEWFIVGTGMAVYISTQSAGGAMATRDRVALQNQTLCTFLMKAMPPDLGTTSDGQGHDEAGRQRLFAIGARRLDSPTNAYRQPRVQLPSFHNSHALTHRHRLGRLRPSDGGFQHSERQARVSERAHPPRLLPDRRAPRDVPRSDPRRPRRCLPRPVQCRRLRGPARNHSARSVRLTPRKACVPAVGARLRHAHRASPDHLSSIELTPRR